MVKVRVRSLVLLNVIAVTLGCAPKPEPTTRPASMSARQEKAMKDPMGYSPDFDRSDISGGGIADFDKDGFNRDMQNVLNP